MGPTPRTNEVRLKTLPCGPIPSQYLDCIYAAFGPDADLYKDVLQVNRFTATPQELRIAYFRRGRQVLAQQQQGQNRQSARASIADLSKQAKAKFQAVSMAYEILSHPQWKNYYDRCGLSQQAAAEWDVYSAGGSSLSSILRNNKNNRGLPTRQGRSASCSRSIRWSDEVEELVFENIAGGHKHHNKTSSKIKRKIIFETQQELTQHLEQLDELARKQQKNNRTFMSGLLDDFEKSLDGFEQSVEQLSSRLFNLGEKEQPHPQDCSENNDLSSLVARADLTQINDSTDSSDRMEVVDESNSISEHETNEKEVSMNTSRDEHETTRSDSAYFHPITTSEAAPRAVKQANSPTDDNLSVDLFDLLTKPVKPPSPDVMTTTRTRKSTVQPSVSNKPTASNVEDVADKLFADLTKPVPKEWQTDMLDSRKQNQQQQQPQIPKPKGNTKAAQKATEFSKLHRQQHHRRNNDRKKPEVVTEPVNEPPTWVDKRKKSDASVSTMSMTEAFVLSERAKWLSLEFQNLEEPKNVSPVPERQQQHEDDIAVDQLLMASYHGSFDSGLQSFETNDSDILKLERTKSAVSSITGFGSTWTEANHVGAGLCQMSHGHKKLKATTSCTANPVCITPSPPEKKSETDCVETVEDEAEDDFVTRFMNYCRAMSNDISKMSCSVANWLPQDFVQSISVPESDLQGMLDAVHHGMDEPVSASSLRSVHSL